MRYIISTLFILFLSSCLSFYNVIVNPNDYYQLNYKVIAENCDDFSKKVFHRKAAGCFVMLDFLSERQKVYVELCGNAAKSHNSFSIAIYNLHGDLLGFKEVSLVSRFLKDGQAMQSLKFDLKEISYAFLNNEKSGLLELEVVFKGKKYQYKIVSGTGSFGFSFDQDTIKKPAHLSDNVRFLPHPRGEMPSYYGWIEYCGKIPGTNSHIKKVYCEEGHLIREEYFEIEALNSMNGKINFGTLDGGIVHDRFVVVGDSTYSIKKVSNLNYGGWILTSALSADEKVKREIEGKYEGCKLNFFTDSTYFVGVTLGKTSDVLKIDVVNFEAVKEIYSEFDNDETCYNSTGRKVYIYDVNVDDFWKFEKIKIGGKTCNFFRICYKGGSILVGKVDGEYVTFRTTESMRDKCRSANYERKFKVK